MAQLESKNIIEKIKNICYNVLDAVAVCVPLRFAASAFFARFLGMENKNERKKLF